MKYTFIIVCKEHGEYKSPQNKICKKCGGRLSNYLADKKACLMKGITWGDTKKYEKDISQL